MSKKCNQKMRWFRICGAAFVCLLLVCFIPTQARAEEITSGDWKYEVLSDGTVSIKKISGYS